MAAQSRTQVRSKVTEVVPAARGGKAPVGFERPSLRSRASQAAATVRDRLPRLELAERSQREVVAVGLLLLAVLSAWALGRGGRDGAVVTWWGDALEAAYGAVGAWLVPVLVGLAAVRFFRDLPGPVLLARHYLGGFGFAVATVGLLELGARPAGGGPGGNLGAGVVTVARDLLGEVGAGVSLLAVGWVAVFLLAGTSVRSFAAEVRRLAPNGLPRLLRRAKATWSSDDAEGDACPVLLEPPVAVPVVAAVVVEEAPPARRALAPGPPLINVPKREPRPAGAADQREEPRPVEPGLPAPLPDIGQLAYYEEVTHDPGELEGRARLIEETLRSFKVEARVREVNPGPAVTQYALEPGVGIKVRRITELQNDLALALAAPSIRIEAPVPGMARVGLEIPNLEVARVGLREVLESPTFARGKQKLPIPLGRDVNGRCVVGDLTKMPHLLIAGATGSGKSVCLNGIITTILLTRQPADVRLLMIDPKMVELTGYNGVPHLQCPVVTEMDKVVGALRLVLREMERRYTLFSRLGVRNLDGYRMKIADEPGAEALPYLVVVIDELADLMMTAPDEVEGLLVRLAQMARATGIHLIIATQRPSVDVLTGLLKANVPARVAFQVSSGIDSRVVLDMPGAERLLGRGDMLFLPPDAAKPQRIQGAFLDDAEVQYVVGHWHTVTPVPQYAQEWLDLPSSSPDDVDAEEDPLWEQALTVAREQGTASASMLQRRLRVGYNRAARLIERMEDEDLIGPADGLKGRPFLGPDA